MSTITTINSGDLITNSRSTINTNFANLNTDKFEKTDVDVDTTLAANSDTKVASQKATKAYVDAKLVASTVVVESTAGTTHSLTTTAGQRVVVWAKGIVTGSAGGTTINLQYNGVTKDSGVVLASSGTHQTSFCLMYTDIPGAGTQNITVNGAAGSVVIMVIKF